MMNSSCNQKDVNKEVCSKPIANIGQTNLDRYVLLKSPKGKVTYKVTKQISDIFDSKNYKSFFRLLSLIENDLKEPLDFTVELDYITLEAFKRCGKDDDNRGYINLKKKIGTKIFNLLNDISIRKCTSSSEEIQDSYLCYSDLENLKEYYEKYEEMVMGCFRRNYSSLPLYDILYKSKTPSNYLDNIYKAIKDENECVVKRHIASALVVEYLTEMSIYASERTREELSYQISQINKRFDELCCQDLALISCDSKFIIDHVYNLL